jgi:thiamine biosynthesis lipoprotein ApbE
MQIFELDTLGTKLRITIDAPHSCEEVFSEIRDMLLEFDKKYSRFIPGNWLDTLNRSGGGELDVDSKIMLDFSLELAHQTHGIFDPTIGARLTQLGYGSRETVMF